MIGVEGSSCNQVCGRRHGWVEQLDDLPGPFSQRQCTNLDELKMVAHEGQEFLDMRPFNGRVDWVVADRVRRCLVDVIESRSALRMWQRRIENQGWRGPLA